MTRNDIDALLSDPNLLPAEREALERLLRPDLPEHAPIDSDASSEALGSGTGSVARDGEEGGKKTVSPYPPSKVHCRSEI